MGCDIHAYVENLVELGEEEHAWSVARFYLGRNYAMFSLMAQVRSDGERPWLFKPRGVPQNMGHMAYSDYTVMAGEQLSVEQITQWVESGLSVWMNEKHHVASGPDWHSASWLNDREMRGVINAYAKDGKVPTDWRALVATLEALGSTSRVVFWFDN